jgi:hypothetical protein
MEQYGVRLEQMADAHVISYNVLMLLYIIRDIDCFMYDCFETGYLLRKS